jgi:hypothetical protein
MAVNIGNLVVKNKPTPAPKPAPTAEVKEGERLIARFYKESRYMKDMINN